MTEYKRLFNWHHQEPGPFLIAVPDVAKDVRTEILALARLLQQFGPQLGRPRVDTLKGSRHRNIKELRFDVADGVWRYLSLSTRSPRRSCWLRRQIPR